MAFQRQVVHERVDQEGIALCQFLGSDFAVSGAIRDRTKASIRLRGHGFSKVA